MPETLPLIYLDYLLISFNEEKVIYFLLSTNIFIMFLARALHNISCKQWFHPKCQELSVDASKALSKYDFIWLCMHCKPKFMALLEVEKSLETCIEKSERRIIDIFKGTQVKDQYHEQLKENFNRWKHQ